MRLSLKKKRIFGIEIERLNLRVEKFVRECKEMMNNENRRLGQQLKGFLCEISLRDGSSFKLKGFFFC
jgi:hypothetical protein